MEYEKCYVFQPEDEPPQKKRRLGASGLHKTWPSRRNHFNEAWKSLDEAFSVALSSVNEQNVSSIHGFLQNARAQDDDKLPTGFILLDPGSSSKSSLLESFLADESFTTRTIALESGAAPNLKTALKSINTAAMRSADASLDVEAVDDADEDEPVAVTGKSLRKPKGRRLLAYDLEILKEYTIQSNTSSLIIHLEDTEGFDGGVLSDLIEHLSYWCDRIPMILLMNVSTSIDMLERRLTRTARSKLRSRIFPAATCEEEFECLVRVLLHNESTVVLGPSIIRLAAQRQGDYLQDIALIKEGLKYALMCAYFANPLTMLLAQTGGSGKRSIPSDLAEALRIVPSFRAAIRDLLDSNDAHQARTLLTNDEALRSFASEQVQYGRAAIHRVFAVLDVLSLMQRHIPSTKGSPLATLYIQGLSGTLRGSASLRGLFLAMRKASLPNIEKVLETLEGLPDRAWQTASESELSELRRLIAASDATGTTSTAATASHTRVTADLVSRLCKTLEAEVDKCLIDPKTLPFHEVFLWDTTSPYREVFVPRPRQALERALSTPHDYLDCDCCGSGEDGDLSASQPATAILYSLYKESGALINVHDAWQAFQAVLGEDNDDTQTMALFQRSLAEMKHIGMVKNTRKRVDHIAKVAWPGL
ncbi:hypothetical protein AMS68_000961 [Peltaster fructicola]|uniref:Uncharacterized protein n=1 Tax=Peltaster fructicola TaxID=286661 RepID=A0A6H0XL39_9PEZI|nr:hypothetical protein AMS68_000961 [Peltaster fructicola]